MRTKQYLGRGDWTKIVLHVYYIYSMHLTKSNLHSTINLFKVRAYTYVNKIYLTSFFALETLFCTKNAARREAESQWITTKLWNKGVATMCLIRSNETQKKARNLTNCKYFDAHSLHKLRPLFNS